MTCSEIVPPVQGTGFHSLGRRNGNNAKHPPSFSSDHKRTTYLNAGLSHAAKSLSIREQVPAIAELGPSYGRFLQYYSGVRRDRGSGGMPDWWSVP